eukprot:TRINITY_DN6753_c0_g8_i1.p1 TRINITY_DN6753_c0_g8~~TRINITY_DN6753_c0_g8_i1.p1  ORF type:complete len:226 (-),score=50.13 TRINITY_DN6753_c0_g8_i1:56-706(-)
MAAGLPPPLTAAEAELRELRSSQERAVNEALRSAWESEARERRETDAKLEALNADWLPLRERLIQLSRMAHRCREELVAGAVSERRATLPLAPEEDSWLEEHRVPSAARALGNCLEAISKEVAAQVSAVKSPGPALRESRPSSSFFKSLQQSPGQSSYAGSRVLRGSNGTGSNAPFAQAPPWLASPPRNCGGCGCDVSVLSASPSHNNSRIHLCRT